MTIENDEQYSYTHYSNAEIVNRLNALGLKINEKRIHEIFRNPFYCGILVTKMLPGEIIEGRHKGRFCRINLSII